MHIGGEYIQNLPMNMELGFFFFKKDKFEKTPSHAFSLGVGLNKFHFQIVQHMLDLWNLEL